MSLIKGKKPNRALIIFIKNPDKGKVKTRLAKDVGDEVALDIYIQLLEHTKNISLKVPEVNRWLFYHEEIREDSWPVDEFRKELQMSGDLGAKMNDAFIKTLSENDKAVIIGSDCAQLNSSIILSAFESLDQHDFVLGPTWDGGYYLLGMKKPSAFLFEHMNWSTSTVFESTIDRIKHSKQTYYLTETLSDIDHLEDWEKYGLNPNSE